MDYNVLAFIGRFQPFHNGHKSVVEKALTLADKVAIVIGTHDEPRNSRNPFTSQERIEMITAVFPTEVADGRIQFVPQVDHRYNLDRWIAGVTSGVLTAAATSGWKDFPPKVGLIGHSKDHTSFYLKSFPNWGSVEVNNVGGVNATDIREGLFLGTMASDEIGDVLPAPVVNWLADWSEQYRLVGNAKIQQRRPSEPFQQIRSEMRFIADYKRGTQPLNPKDVVEWLSDDGHSGDTVLEEILTGFADDFISKFPPIFHTVDAVVVQSAHVLLVQRKEQPGRGLWALPGGFLNQEETLIEGAIRELREETTIKVPLPVLRGSIIASQTFDDPHRSLRGRTITNAFYLRLADQKYLPKVRAADDAADCKWVPLNEVTRAMMFEDHYDIIETMVGI